MKINIILDHREFCHFMIMNYSWRVHCYATRKLSTEFALIFVYCRWLDIDEDDHKTERELYLDGKAPDERDDDGDDDHEDEEDDDDDD